MHRSHLQRRAFAGFCHNIDLNKDVTADAEFVKRVAMYLQRSAEQAKLLLPAKSGSAVGDDSCFTGDDDSDAEDQE